MMLDSDTDLAGGHSRMMGSLDKLVYMANQIERAFRALGHDEAAAATADHIAMYWDPRMKSMIFGHLGEGGAGLEPVALTALTSLRDAGAPAHQTRATEFNAVDESGHADAG